ncbi:hypothetical protein RNJ44_02366 [Nakaseomyces bracarensis]|uniref:Uncharacterized protein n=1 Tax=Nakaseomyces bracarensis TaxID=273131 RepID=A0ABR4NN98_9SACH
MSHPYRQQLVSTEVDSVIKDNTDTISASSSLPRRPEMPEDISISGPEFDSTTSFNNVSATSLVSETPVTNSNNNTASAISVAKSGHKKNNSSTNLRSLRSRSVDLSHMYLLNGSHDTQLTSTNESVADLSHRVVSQYLNSGENDNSHSNPLVPRLKTIEMYRENVKKSKDPNLLFQYAQYMLQTALTIESSNILDQSKDEEESLKLKKQFLKEAQSYLKKLSAKGYADAQYLLGDAYSSGVFGKVDNKEAFILFQAAAKHGHVESAYRTAHCFEEGLGTTRDARKALNFLKFAASRNHPSAMYKLGLYSYHGRMGLPNDVNTKQNGIKWLSRAAARANELTCAAPYELAKIYETGYIDIIIPDEKYALELYVQAATLGHTPSCTLLGQRYETGDDFLPQDTSLSVHYYTQAALKGDPVAMLGLCAWYLVGAEPAFEKDENEAFQWALRAATLKYPKAQFTLGYFYEHGKGCEVNLDNAWKWYARAAENNDSRAINKMNNKPKSLNETKPANTRKHKKSNSVNTLNLFTRIDKGVDEWEDSSKDNNPYKSGDNNINNSKASVPSFQVSPPTVTYFSQPSSTAQSPDPPAPSKIHRSIPQSDVRVIKNTQFKSEQPNLPTTNREGKEKKKKKNDCIVM